MLGFNSNQLSHFLGVLRVSAVNHQHFVRATNQLEGALLLTADSMLALMPPLCPPREGLEREECPLTRRWDVVVLPASTRRSMGREHDHFFRNGFMTIELHSPDAGDLLLLPLQPLGLGPVPAIPGDDADLLPSAAKRRPADEDEEKDEDEEEEEDEKEEDEDDEDEDEDAEEDADEDLDEDEDEDDDDEDEDEDDDYDSPDEEDDDFDDDDDDDDFDDDDE